MTDETATTTARQHWRVLEPLHAVTYFTPIALTAWSEAGVRGFWRGYFAGRCAPLGPVTAPPVLAAFFSFAPAMVTRALPAIWDLIAPERALEVRRTGGGAALAAVNDELTTGALTPDTLAEANAALDTVLARLHHDGRILGAVNGALPAPDDPWQRLWQAATTVREHRGDGHIAALVAAGLTGLETIVWRCAHDLARSTLQPARGWTDEEWDATAVGLTGRGWLDGDGRPTPASLATFADIEHRTDLVATPVGGGVDLDRLHALLTPLARACVAHLPVANPIGLTAPAALPAQ